MSLLEAELRKPLAHGAIPVAVNERSSRGCNGARAHACMCVCVCERESGREGERDILLPRIPVV